MFRKSPEQDILDLINELPKGFKEYWEERNSRF